MNTLNGPTIEEITLAEEVNRVFEIFQEFQDILAVKNRCIPLYIKRCSNSERFKTSQIPQEMFDYISNPFHYVEEPKKYKALLEKILGRLHFVYRNLNKSKIETRKPETADILYLYEFVKDLKDKLFPPNKADGSTLGSMGGRFSPKEG